MAVIGLDIGNAYAYASVLEPDTNDASRELRDPMILLPASYSGPGISTDATVLPDGSIYVATELEEGARPRIAPSQRATIRAVKSMLYQDKIECSNRAGTLFQVSTGRIYSEIIKRIVSVANSVRIKDRQEPIYNVVVAVPSVFSDDENTKTLMEKVRTCVEDVNINGHKLSLMGTIPEPAAVALDYLHYMQYLVEPEQRVKDEEYTVVVYDLGQGTFDTALTTVRSSDGHYELLHHDGIAYGGQDMDAMILEHFMAQISEVVQDEKLLTRARNSDELMRRVSRAKEELSTEERWDTDPFSVGGEVVDLSITRDEFEEMIEDPIRDTLEQLEMMLDFAERIGRRVNAVVMSGGCSNIPFIQSRVSELATRRGLEWSLYRPSKAVSFGAARYGYRQEMMTRRTGYTYSVLLESEEELGGILREVIPFQQTLPYISNPIELKNQYRGEFWICRSLDEKDPADKDSKEPFKRMLRFQVDLPENAEFEAVFSINEEYVIDIDLYKS